MNANDPDSTPSSPSPDADLHLTPAPRTSLGARLLNVYAAPGEVFDEVKAGPPCAANWLMPLLLLVLVAATGAWLVHRQPALQQQREEAAAKLTQRLIERGKLTAEQAAEAEARRSRSPSAPSLVGPIVGAAAVSALTPFWGALVLWLVGSKALRGRYPFSKALEAAGLASMVDLLGAVVKTLLILAFVNLYASPSPALLLKDFDWLNPAHLALACLDVFTLWLYGVRAVAISRLSGRRLGVCLAWMFGLWAVFSGLFLGGLLAFRAFLGL